MTIKSKLLAGFGASAVLVAGVVMLSMRDLNRITRAMQDTSDSSLPEIRETHRAMEGASALLVQTEAVDNDPADFNAEAIHQSDIAAKSAFNEIQSAIEGLRAESENQLSILTNSDDIAEEHEHLDKVNELAANAETGQQEWTKLQSLLQSRSTGAIHDQISHTEAAVQKVISQALSLQAESEDEINEVIASITKDALFAGKVSVIAGSIAFLSAILIATLVSRPIVQRLARVRERAEEIGRGDLSARLDVHGNDEIGQLSKSFNHMTHMLAKTRDELLRAATAAEAASTAKSSFLANMSHEIRTPMTAVVGFAEMLLEPEQSQSDRVDALQTIRRNSRHLLELINDVLDISKIEAGKMTVERIDCDLLRLLVEVVSMTRPRAVEKGLSLHLTFDGEIPKTIRSDALRLRQILVNLIGNAIKFTSSGNIKLHVGTERIENDILLRFAISDTGIGMTTEQMGKLFQVFSQADESTTRRFGGSGLGLTISQRLAKLLGGSIEVQSMPGEGSTFTVTIDGGPFRATEMLCNLSESLLPHDEAESNPRGPAGLRGRILLVEDGIDNQRLISTHLRKAGAEVVIAENGKIAVDLMESETFDLILMDMQMPVMDGYTAAGVLRSRGLTLPIVALTAHAMAEDRAKCLNAGCTEYLTKPVNKGQLIALLAKLTNQSTTADEAVETSLVRQAGPIRSTLAGDEDMKELLEEFIQRLPARVAQMKDLIEQQDLESLRHTVHQLKGAGGGYGFQSITQHAAAAERRIKDSQSLDSIRQEIDSLIAVIQRVEGYSALQSPIAA